jgi:glyoxylate carboligase
MSQQMNGGQALIKALELEGVEVMFGLPGGAILPVYDPIIDSPIRHTVTSSCVTSRARATWPRASPMPRADLAWPW